MSNRFIDAVSISEVYTTRNYISNGGSYKNVEGWRVNKITNSCTFTDAGDLVTSTAHGLQNGDGISFTSITSTTGISINVFYYVVSATTNTFQVSATLNGSALALTTDGSGIFVTQKPSTAVGGTPDITFTRSTTGTVLRSTASFNFLKDAANRMGQQVDYAFTIDNADKAKVMSISFDCLLQSGTYDNTFPDLQVWIIDDTNVQIIQPSAYKLDAINSTTPTTFKAQFQTSSNASIYRLVIVCSSVSASTYTVKFDNFQVGQQQLGATSAMTDWVAYTPTFGGAGTVTNVSFFWRRVGDSAEIQGMATTGTVTGSAATISLPSGMTIASKISPNVSGNAQVVGYLLYNSVSTTTFNSAALATPGNAFLQVGIQTNGVSAATPGVGTAVYLANTREITLFARVPISGWGSTVSLAGAESARVVSAIVSGDPASATSGNPIIFPTVSFDSHGAYNATTGRYTVPVSGIYKMFGACIAGATVGIGLNIYKNAVVDITIGGPSVTGSGYSFAGSVRCNAGDIIDIRPNGTLDMASSAQMSIERIAGPEAIGAGESIAMQAYRTTAMSTIANNTETTLLFDVVGTDTHGAYVPGTGIWTCPQNGMYTISAGSLWTTNATGVRVLGVKVNSSIVASFSRVTGSASEQLGGSGSIVVRILAGQQVTVYGLQSSGGALAPYSDVGRWMFFSIVRNG